MLRRSPIVTDDAQWVELEGELVDSGQYGPFFSGLLQTGRTESLTDLMSTRQQMQHSGLLWLNRAWLNVLRWLDTRKVTCNKYLYCCYCFYCTLYNFLCIAVVL